MFFPKLYLSIGLVTTCFVAISSAQQEQGDTNRIIGGTTVSSGTYPWFTALSSNSSNVDHFCGGMLVSPEWVLTAAHCLDDLFDVMLWDGTASVGAFDAPYESGDNGGQAVEVFNLDDIFLHPNYDNATMNNDFALLKLEGQSSITPVNMDSSSISNSFSTGELVPTLFIIS